MPVNNENMYIIIHAMIKNKLLFTLVLSLFTAAGVLSAHAAGADKGNKSPAQPPITGLTAADMPYDVGGTVLLAWDALASVPPGTVYQVFVSSLETGGWIKAGDYPADGVKPSSEIELPFWAWRGSKTRSALRVEVGELFAYKVTTERKSALCLALEKSSLLRAILSRLQGQGLFGGAGKPEPYTRVIEYKDGIPLNFKVVAELAGKQATAVQVKGSTASNWFRLDRLNNLLLLIVIVIVFFWAVSHAKRKGLFIRRIAGLDAIDEAIGRATEMGKPIYYVPGIGGMSGISTIASSFILGEVSQKVAQYDSQIKVPHYDPIVMTVCKEVVKQAFLEAGRPDSYRDDINFFVSQDQFSYAASVDGMISREKPAAVFFMGYFMAESLLLAEVGATSGAIQIAGTDVESQLPFFFTACDYTLIGEELYAAGAYLSKEPMLLSALKVQDFGKLLVMVSVFFGIILVAVGAKLHWDPFIEVILNLFKAY